jgi:hypothetical protein
MLEKIYFYLDLGNLVVTNTPPEEIEYCTYTEALRHSCWLGSCGFNQHQFRDDFHVLCNKVLRWLVENYGEKFEVLYRGSRSDRLDSEYKILFGSTDEDVAAHYGPVKIYRNVKGFKHTSLLKSVKTDDYTESDEEVIFFP